MQRLAFIAFILVVIAAVYFFNQDRLDFGNKEQAAKTAITGTKPTNDLENDVKSLLEKSKTGGPSLGGETGNENSEGSELFLDEDVSASQLYKSSDEALAAVKKGALTYDDDILQRFVNIGNCTWCGPFFNSVKELAANGEVDLSQRGFYAELLAVSGNIDNVKWLVDQLENSKNEQVQEIFSEAIEFSSGNDDLVNYLSSQLGSSNQLLKEGAAAAITNQGSKLAAEILYKNAIENKNPDGLYSLGLGLGELMPSSEEVLPYLQEIVQKRDEYSHLGVKSLFNAGLPGAHMVFDTLANSKDPELDRAMLADAADHVPFDEETKSYLTTMSQKSPNPVLREFAQNVLKDFEQEETEEKQ